MARSTAMLTPFSEYRNEVQTMLPFMTLEQVEEIMRESSSYLSIYTTNGADEWVDKASDYYIRERITKLTTERVVNALTNAANQSVDKEGYISILASDVALLRGVLKARGVQVDSSVTTTEADTDND